MGRAVRAGLFALLVLSGCAGSSRDDPGPTSPAVPPPAEPFQLAWGLPVDLRANGYEPSLDVDSTGTLYVTAHKELNRPDTWPYPASWMLRSGDAGQTWTSLTSPAQAHEQYAGIEGDVAVDGRDWVYFLDTYLGNNHLHVWSDHGQKWERSTEQHSTAADDRPWLAAQGDGILHYLGNNGVVVGGGRYWYYRSTDAGLTWTAGAPVAGNGWATVAAERRGNHVYVATEAAPESGDVKIQASADRGATWGPLKTVAPRGEGNRYPVVAVDDGGAVYVLYSSAAGLGRTKLHLTRSVDGGATWVTADITPFEGYIDYPWVDAGPAGLVGVGFYATRDVPLADGSKWFVYGGLAVGADGSSGWRSSDRDLAPVLDNRSMPRFNFTRADPAAVYTGRDTHALHDFFEVAVGPDGALNVAYQYTLGRQSEDGERKLHFVRGQLDPAGACPGCDRMAE